MGKEKTDTWMRYVSYVKICKNLKIYPLNYSEYKRKLIEEENLF